MAFTVRQTVRFQHCDPAEIVFYPRYYEMLNAAIEEWFEHLGWSFAEIHGAMGMGVPTVAQEARYHAPSRLGDRLDFTLAPLRLGRSSVTLAVEAACSGERRVTFTTTLVWIAKADGRPRPWPEALRARIADALREGREGSMIETIQPDGWKTPKGYANGVLADGRLYVGGQIGWTADQVFEARDFVGQMEQALANIVAIVRAAGGEPHHITRLTWYVTDKRAYLARQREVGEAYRRVMGRHFPAMTMVVVAGLVEDEALVEIEANAEIGPN